MLCSFLLLTIFRLELIYSSDAFACMGQMMGAISSQETASTFCAGECLSLLAELEQLGQSMGSTESPDSADNGSEFTMNLLEYMCDIDANGKFCLPELLQMGVFGMEVSSESESTTSPQSEESGMNMEFMCSECGKRLLPAIQNLTDGGNPEGYMSPELMCKEIDGVNCFGVLNEYGNMMESQPNTMDDLERTQLMIDNPKLCNPCMKWYYDEGVLDAGKQENSSKINIPYNSLCQNANNSPDISSQQQDDSSASMPSIMTFGTFLLLIPVLTELF